jgi:hypothetical protein
MATTSPAPEDDRKMTASGFRSRVLSHVECGHERREQMRRLMLGFAVVVAVAVAPLASATSRSGDLVVTKECSGFVPTNNPPYCTITSSNLGAIPDGSRILYLDPNGLGTPTGGAVVLDPPGLGNNQAFGTCFLGGNPMRCEFSGGTGRFTWFHASVVVTVTDLGTTDELWHWEGTYSFDPH